jgi:phospholipid/cholesterol/gamma-HCH transport system permease protein
MRIAVESIGRSTVNFVADLGAFFMMLYGLLRSFPSFFKRIKLVLEQMLLMGVRSLPLVLLTSVFTGSITAWQAAYNFRGFVPLEFLGLTVAKTVFTELAPVLTALVVAGRVGASIAAELGTMRVTEQIDAMETMGIDPIGYLIMPRFVSGLIMLPALVMFANVIAIIGGLFVSIYMVGISHEMYFDSIKSYTEAFDLLSGLIKAFGFGVIISLSGCFYGFNAAGGAEGVGQATTKAVVLASVLILISDYVMASILFRV